MLRIVPSVLALWCGAATLLSAQANSVARQPLLIGTWRVARFCSPDSTGQMSDPLGLHPEGLFVYTPTGQLSIQAMRTPPIGPLLSDSTLVTMDQLRGFYFGYFGTYTILSDSTVIHHVAGGTIPSYIGTDQPRPYRIRGDTLSIGGTPILACRILLRVRE